MLINLNHCKELGDEDIAPVLVQSNELINKRGSCD
jgi:hypothetical protein